MCGRAGGSKARSAEDRESGRLKNREAEKPKGTGWRLS
jgi:hypothetical protein